jgi:predicted ATPase/class 3 adenylate cyclase
VTELPSGTLTFLFTDLEGSTALWEAHPEVMAEAVTRHEELLSGSVVAHGGHVVKTTGDGLVAVFDHATEAVAAAMAGQRALMSAEWDVPIRARMGLATGEAEPMGADYHAPVLNRAARVMDAGHGGQVLVGSGTANLVRGVLADGAGLEDLGEYRLRDLASPEHLFQLVHADLAPTFPALRTLDAYPGSLPLFSSSFVGREREVSRTVEALENAPVVTLTGVGGVGKTRLACQVAAEVLPTFRDGAWLVELAPVRSSDGVMEAVAGVFDVAARDGRSLEDTLLGFLHHKKLLIVLDNCEHLLDEAAALIESLEQQCLGVRVLATSREGFGIDSERILAVPSLRAPSTDALPHEVETADAVQLFVQRARQRASEFRVTIDNAEAVADLCRRLDGVPLAIELAAARVPAMNPGEILARLDQRFEVLAGGRRGKIERHQTLRATIDWSYELLAPDEQKLLARVAVFTGGWTLPAAEAVCAGDLMEPVAVFSSMERLVAQSLVVAEDLGFQTRYRLLETIRQYAEERMADADETDDLRHRHAEYYVAFAGELKDGLDGVDQIALGRQLSLEHENILAGVGLAIETGDTDLAFRFVRRVPGRTVQRGFELRLPVEELLRLPDARDHAFYPLVLAETAVDAAWAGGLALAEQSAAAAEEANEGTDTEVTALVAAIVPLARGMSAMDAGDWLEAAAHSERSAEAARSIPSLPFEASQLIGAAQYYGFIGDTDAAIPLATRGLEVARRSQQPNLIVLGLAGLANALAETEPERARALLQQAVEEMGQIGLESSTAVTNGVLVAGRLGDWPLALEMAARSIPMLHWNSDRPQLGGVLNVTARALVDHDPDAAATLLGAARGLAPRAVTLPSPPPDPPPRAPAGPSTFGIVANLRREASVLLDDIIGAERRRELRGEGEAMDQDHAVALALGAIEHARAAG